jgi:hypothetical protein
MLREYLVKDAESAPASCVLRFDGVMSLVVSRAQGDTDPRNARTIISIGRVLPREMTPSDLLEQGGRIPATGDDGHLLFSFMDGFDIELAAESVTLEAK